MEQYELLYCDCAGCHETLLGTSEINLHHARLQLGDELDIVLKVAGRIKGRPYCYNCLCIVRPYGRQVNNRKLSDKDRLNSARDDRE